jgi:hypothetical protein
VARGDVDAGEVLLHPGLDVAAGLYRGLVRGLGVRQPHTFEPGAAAGGGAVVLGAKLLFRVAWLFAVRLVHLGREVMFATFYGHLGPWDWNGLLWDLSRVLIYVFLGLALFAVCYLILDKATPFSFGHEIREN